jgi:hypothetical protein
LCSSDEAAFLASLNMPSMLSEELSEPPVIPSPRSCGSSALLSRILKLDIQRRSGNLVNL